MSWREKPVRDASSIAPRRHGRHSVAEPPRYAFVVGPLTRRPPAALRRSWRCSRRSRSSWRGASTPSGSRASGTSAQTREQEMTKLATEAELRALRAQINPHFLFNALTTIGYLIQTAPPRALETLMRLTSLLRGVLRSEGEFTTLGRELDLVEAYLDIERARFEQRLRVRDRRAGAAARDPCAAARAAAARRERRQARHRGAAGRRPAQRTSRRTGCQRAARARPRRARHRRGRDRVGDAERTRGWRRPAQCRAAARVPVRRRRRRCRFESEAGSGTTVEIRLPVGADVASDALDGNQDGSVTARLRVVVADDERPARVVPRRAAAVVRRRCRRRRRGIGQERRSR